MVSFSGGEVERRTLWMWTFAKLQLPNRGRADSAGPGSPPPPPAALSSTPPVEPRRPAPRPPDPSPASRSTRPPARPARPPARPPTDARARPTRPTPPAQPPDPAARRACARPPAARPPPPARPAARPCPPRRAVRQGTSEIDISVPAGGACVLRCKSPVTSKMANCVAGGLAHRGGTRCNMAGKPARYTSRSSVNYRTRRDFQNG